MVLRKLVKAEGRSVDAKVTVSDKFLISFNSACVQDYNLATFSHVIVNHDDENDQIVLQLTNDANDEGSLKLNKSAKNAAFSAASLFKSNGIKNGGKMRYTAEYNSKDNTITFTLGKGVESKTRNAKAK